MRRLVSIAAVLVASAGCGSSPNEAPPTAELAKAGEQLARDIASGKAASGPVVPFEKLMPFLPQIPGWERDEPKGELMTVGVTVSNASAKYTKGDSELEIEIGDSSMSSAFLAPYAAILRGEYSQKTAEGYTKATKVGGFPASEEWQHEVNWGEFKIIVAERFVVTVRGNAVPNVDAVRQAAETMDLKGLAAVK